MSAPAAAGLLTLVGGPTVCVSQGAGDVEPGGAQGVFHQDVRVLSRLALTIAGRASAPLAAHREGASRAEWVHALGRDADGGPTVVLVRVREVAAGSVRERLTALACGPPPGDLTVELACACDFADLPPLRAGPSEHAPVAWELDGLTHRVRGAGLDVRLRARGEGVAAAGAGPAGGYTWSPRLERGGRATLELELSAASPRERPAPGFVAAPEPPETLRVRSRAPRWERSVASALADLRGLRVEVPALNLRYIAAGAPWYMALFGRDTLLAAWESLPAGTQRALEVLHALADRQGRRFDPVTSEQPGRILHELRTGLAGVFGIAPGTPYYGTVDATPLFVMLLAETHRWGAPAAEVRALLPAARAAVAWCAEHGDVDGDGFVEYLPDQRGLVNQGWKDSAGALVHADGARARGPIALAEVQGYVHAACRDLAELERRVGEAARAAAHQARAERLRAAFEAAFWLPEQATVALALDGDKRPLAVPTSNIGHVLWSGILRPEVGAAAADRLARPDVAATWGLRTLSSAARAYNPLGYHTGTIWPHDTAIGIAGLVRHGRLRAARALLDGLLRVAEAFAWRLPELLGGLGAEQVGQPVPYPVACSPQAWSAAAPLLLLRAFLRLDPDVPAGVVHVAPVLDDDEELCVRGVPLGEATLDLRVRGSEVDVLTVPAGLRVVAAPRLTG